MSDLGDIEFKGDGYGKTAKKPRCNGTATWSGNPMAGSCHQGCQPVGEKHDRHVAQCGMKTCSDANHVGDLLHAAKERCLQNFPSEVHRERQHQQIKFVWAATLKVHFD